MLQKIEFYFQFEMLFAAGKDSVVVRKISTKIAGFYKIDTRKKESFISSLKKNVSNSFFLEMSFDHSLFSKKGIFPAHMHVVFYEY